MKYFACLIMLSLCWTTSIATSYQSIIQVPGKLIHSDSYVIDEQGWIHFFNSNEEVILLSLKSSKEFDISLLKVQSGLLGKYGEVGNNISDNQVFEHTLWVSSNRYWRIHYRGNEKIDAEVRFYFDPQDVKDIQTSF